MNFKDHPVNHVPSQHSPSPQSEQAGELWAYTKHVSSCNQPNEVDDDSADCFCGLNQLRKQWKALHPTEQAGEKEGDNMSIDALLSEFNRQGINTENWDGDEGAEKAIVDGVRRWASEKEELYDKALDLTVEQLTKTQKERNEAQVVKALAGEELRESAIEYLRGKKILGEEYTKWIIRYESGVQLDIVDVLVEFAALWQAASQEKGVGWVKASESGLPVLWWEKHWRYSDGKSKVNTEMLETANGQLFVIGDNNPLNLDNMEWLDESSPLLQEAAAISLLKEYGELEAEIIADNTLWWPYREDDALRGKIYDKMIELQGKRNEILAPPKPNNEIK